MTIRIFASAVVTCLLLITAPDRAISQALAPAPTDTLRTTTLDATARSLTTSTCTDDSQCNDQNACTTDKCDLSKKTCTFTPVSGCCVSDTQCDDKNACTADRCILSAAVRASTGSCANEPIPNCCTDVSQCDDQDPCTEDTCKASATATAATAPTCQHVLIDGCRTPPPPSDECAKYTDTKSQDYQCCKDPSATACQSCLDQNQLFALKAKIDELKSFYAEQRMEVSLNIDLEKCEASYTITYVKSSTTQSFPIKICSCAECPNAQTVTASTTSLSLETMSHIYGLPCLTLDQAKKLGTVEQSGQTFTITSSIMTAEQCKLIKEATFSDKGCIFSISECSCEKPGSVLAARTASRETATAIAPPPAARPPAPETPPTTAQPPPSPEPTSEEPAREQPTPPTEAGTAEERKEEVTVAGEEGATVPNGPEKPEESKPEEPKKEGISDDFCICESGQEEMVCCPSGKKISIAACPDISLSEAFADVHKKILSPALSLYTDHPTRENLQKLCSDSGDAMPQLKDIKKVFKKDEEEEPHSVFKIRFESATQAKFVSHLDPKDLVLSTIEGRLKVAAAPSSLYGALEVTNAISDERIALATAAAYAGGGTASPFSCTLIKDQGSHPSSLVPSALWSTFLFLGALRLSKLKKRRLSPPC